MARLSVVVAALVRAQDSRWELRARLFRPAAAAGERLSRLSWRATFGVPVGASQPLPGADLIRRWAMSTREQRKLQTRKALQQAALDIMGTGVGFGELSLRRVTAQASVVPTAFYRHFESMDELGLLLVDEAFVTLRRLMRDARRKALSSERIIRESVRVYLGYVGEHRQVFGFIARERFGASRQIREAIALGVLFFEQELAEDLATFPNLRHLNAAAYATVAHLVVGTIATLTGDALDALDDADRLRELAIRAEDEILVAILGAAVWRPERRSLRAVTAGDQGAGGQGSEGQGSGESL